LKRFGFVVVLAAVLGSSAFAQQRGRGGRLTVGIAEVTLPASPVVFDTAERHKIPHRRGHARAVASVGERAGSERRRRKFNERWEEIRREQMLLELHQRIRDIRQGPDGLLFVLTDEDQGALLRIEPAQ
jgi:hypothetical protein